MKYKILIGAKRGTVTKVREVAMLEGKGDAATNAARRLDEIDRMAILSNHRHVALREEIAQVNHRFQVAG